VSARYSRSEDASTGPQPRPSADGLLYHALNRGNNRAAVFFAVDVDRAFLRALAQTQARYPFRLHGDCLMTNHFHLLLQPQDGQSISRVLQSLTVAHTWHDHRGHGTVGHVWQGRFKSPVVQDDEHALTVLRYSEANPLRAGMVADLAEYAWSSYPAHGLGSADLLLSPLPGWERLGTTETARQARWRAWVHAPLTAGELEAVRRSVTSGRPFGEVAWTEATARRLRLRVGERPRGPPREQPPFGT
jgi:putative transposase